MERLAVHDSERADTDRGDTEGQYDHLVPSQAGRLRPGLGGRLQSQDAWTCGESSARCLDRYKGLRKPTIGKCSDGQTLQNWVEEK